MIGPNQHVAGSGPSRHLVAQPSHRQLATMHLGGQGNPGGQRASLGRHDEVRCLESRRVQWLCPARQAHQHHHPSRPPPTPAAPHTTAHHWEPPCSPRTAPPVIGILLQLAGPAHAIRTSTRRIFTPWSCHRFTTQGAINTYRHWPAPEDSPHRGSQCRGARSTPLNRCKNYTLCGPDRRNDARCGPVVTRSRLAGRCLKATWGNVTTTATQSGAGQLAEFSRLSP